MCFALPWTSMPPTHTRSPPHIKPRHGHRGRYACLVIRAAAAAAGTRADRCVGVCHVLPAQTPRSGDSLSSEADTWASCSGEPKVRELWFGLKVGARQQGSTQAASRSDRLSDAVMACQADGRGSLPVGQSWRVVLEATRRDWVEPELVWNAQLRHELAQGLAAEVGPAAPITCPHKDLSRSHNSHVRHFTGFRSTSWTM